MNDINKQSIRTKGRAMNIIDICYILVVVNCI